VVNYNTAELVAVMSARALKDGQVVFAGAGMPLLAAIAAQKMHAPTLTILFEGGSVSPRIEIGKMPASTNEARATYGSVMTPSITDMLLFCQRGFVDVGFLGGAQIDKFGNLNTSYIGDLENPDVRLPGSGGANDIASCTDFIVSTHHEKRRFVEKVDFITSPGSLYGGQSRREAGLRGNGCSQVITHLGILEVDVRRGELILAAVHPGVDPREAVENTGWNLIVSENLRETEPPTKEELKLFRSLDPEMNYLKTKD